jgi:ABC-type branched-subunit amino acid transport system substrate-binding protein
LVPAQLVDAAGQGLAKAAALAAALAVVAGRAVDLVEDRAAVSVDRVVAVGQVVVAAGRQAAQAVVPAVVPAVVSQAVPAARRAGLAKRRAELRTMATERKLAVAGAVAAALVVVDAAVPAAAGVVAVWGRVEWGQAVRVADRAVDLAVDAEDVAAAWELAAGSPAAPGCPSMAVGPAVLERSAAAAAWGLAGRGLAGQAVAWALAEQLATRAVPN